jgi:hypothetical protein
MAMNNVHRTQWAQACYLRIRREIVPEAPAEVILTWGFPAKKRNGPDLNTAETQFECFTEAKHFGGDTLIVLHPVLMRDPIEALTALTHQMVRAALPPDEKNGKEFKALAKRVGLLKPWKAPLATDDLRSRLLAISAEVDELPDGHYVLPKPAERKPSAQKKHLCACDSPRVLVLSEAKVRSGPILCGVCKQAFVIRESSPVE